MNLLGLVTRMCSLFVVLTVFLGCGGSSGVDIYPVHGQVFVDRQPATGAEVVFHAVTPPEDPTTPIPRATVGDDGSFVLSSYDTGDGAPAGKYDVTIRWPTTGPTTGDDPEAAAEGRDRLQGRYADPDQSGLEATVLEGDTELEPFQLSSKKE